MEILLEYNGMCNNDDNHSDQQDNCLGVFESGAVVKGR